MNYETLEIDFIERTLAVIAQYEQCELKSDKYEVTLFVNCLTGLLLLPKEKGLLHYLPNENITFLTSLGIDILHIKYTEIKTIKDLATQLRHCLAHFDIKFTDNGTYKIQNIVFEDNQEKKGVIAEFTLLEIKILVKCLAVNMIENYKKYSPKFKK